MKTSQAKAIAGIRYKVATREEHARAERDCVAQIVVARNAGNDTRAAELSEAKTFFQKRARAQNNCSVCGVTISRGAMRCRIHQRSAKALPPPSDQQASDVRRYPNRVGNSYQPKIKKQLNPRKVWNPRDPLALLGYHATPVQKVVRRWRPKIGEDIFDANIESLMITCVCSVMLQDSRKPFHYQKKFALEVALAVEKVRDAWRGKIHNKQLGWMLDDYTTPLLLSITDLGPQLDPIFKAHRLFILELLLAVDYVHNDPDSLPGLILKYGFSGDGSDYVNGRPMLRSWLKISKIIQASSVTETLPDGLSIKPDAIRAEARRMKLTA